MDCARPPPASLAGYAGTLHVAADAGLDGASDLFDGDFVTGAIRDFGFVTFVPSLMVLVRAAHSARHW